MKPDKMVEKMKNSLPVRYEVGTGEVKIEACLLKTDAETNAVKQIMEIKKNNL
jgi:hypothetical protein